MSSNRPAEKSSTIELLIDSLAYGGRGVGRVGNGGGKGASGGGSGGGTGAKGAGSGGGLTVFVDGAVAPGETVRAVVRKRKSNFAEAQLLEIVRPSSARVEPPCPLFGTCGGCSWQHLALETQLDAKQRIVRESLEHVGGLKNVEVRPIVPSPESFRYRNKMDFTFGRGENGQAVIGFHEPGDWMRVLEVPRCWLHPEAFDLILGAATAWARERNLEPYDPKEHSGFLRHLVLRHSQASGGVVAMLLTAKAEIPGAKTPKAGFDTLVETLRAACPALQGVVWGLNPGLADIARNERTLATWGDPILVERLGALEFRISPTSFFQTNTRAAERLYEVAREALELDGRQRLLDAYCGTGTIGLFCAARCQEVWGIEIVREAVWDARENAARNGIGHAKFLVGDLKRALPLLSQSNRGAGAFDRLVVDPPRAGMEKKALRLLLDLRAPILVYVSCNPATLGRDLQSIAEGGYEVEWVTPVDMFPQTFHVESVARCRLAQSPGTVQSAGKILGETPKPPESRAKCQCRQ